MEDLAFVPSGSYGFRRHGETNDIAGFSLYNDDPEGIAIDNIVHDVPNNPIPEPVTLLLLGSGLIGMFGFKKIQSFRS